MSTTQTLPKSPITNDLAQAFDCMPASVIITDLNGVIKYANRTFAETTGYAPGEVLGKTPAVLKSGQTPPEIYEDLWRTIRSGRTWTGRLLNKRKTKLPLRIHGVPPNDNENLYWCRLSVSPVCDQTGEIALFVAIHFDITEEVLHEQRRDYESKEAKVRANVSAILQGKGPLKDRIDESLAELLTLNELRFQSKAGVFILPEDADHLEMFVMHGVFGDDFFHREKNVPLGKCLCGRAAVSGEILISDDCFCDPRHENSYEGMTNHGHYIVPLRAGGETFGIMFLYTDPHPPREPSRIMTLEAVGDAMALAIANDLVQNRLIAASRSAVEANETKSRFLANMSHEIRTPLGGILGFTDLLRQADDAVNPDDLREWVEIIHRSGQHLLNIINDILDLSKVEANQLEVEQLPCSLAEIFAELSSLFRFKAGEKGLEFNVDADGSIPDTITTDPTRFRQILTNLIGNAVKFTNAGSVTVTVRVARADDETVTRPNGTPSPKPGILAETALLEIDVSDTGPGIPTDKLDAVFDPFVQADSSVTRESGGTGLGLAISKRMAAALGGSLSVRSQVGHGSVFTLRVPAGPLGGVLWIDDLAMAIVHPGGSGQALKANQVSLSGHILLVDDAESNLRLISLILRRAGAWVTTAPDGQTALNLMKQHPFDLVLMDMQMPILDGYAATRALRAKGCTTPIVALTAHAMRSDREKCLAAGCDEYLHKPIDFDQLLTCVARLIRLPESPGPGSSQPTDPHTEAVLRSSLPMDDEEFRVIVEEFVDKLHEKLATMRAAWEAGDFAELAHAAHWLKGVGGTAGFNAITSHAADLERLVISRQIDKIGVTLDRLMDLAGRIRVDVPGDGDERNMETATSS